MGKQINRRTANVVVASTVAGVLVSTAATESSAFLPLLLRLIIQGAFRTTATRTITTTAVRTLAAGVTRTAVTSFQSVASLGISATGLVGVSAAVWAMTNQHKAKQIWVAGAEVVNRFLLTSDKQTAELERVFVGYRVIDVATGNEERKSVRMGSSAPGSKPFEFPFEVRQLPNPGLKRVEAFVSIDEAGLVPHNGFQLPEPQLVVVADPAEVSFG